MNNNGAATFQVRKNCLSSRAMANDAEQLYADRFAACRQGTLAACGLILEDLANGTEFDDPGVRKTCAISRRSHFQSLPLMNRQRNSLSAGEIVIVDFTGAIGIKRRPAVIVLQRFTIDKT